MTRPVLEVQRYDLPSGKKEPKNRWLTAACEKGNAAVRTRNVLLDELKVVNTYQWVVRSNTGTGMLGRA